MDGEGWGGGVIVSSTASPTGVETRIEMGLFSSKKPNSFSIYQNASVDHQRIIKVYNMYIWHEIEGIVSYTL